MAWSPTDEVLVPPHRPRLISTHAVLLRPPQPAWPPATLLDALQDQQEQPRARKPSPRSFVLRPRD